MRISEFFVLLVTTTVAEAQYIVTALNTVLKSGCDRDDLHSHLLEISSDGMSKTLGIMWCHAEDSFVYSTSDFQTSPITKRAILSDTSKIFYPLALVGPNIITLKTLTQQLWIKTVQWNLNVSSDIAPT